MPPGQTEAAKALSLRYVSRMRDVILPQAIRISLPATTPDLLSGKSQLIEWGGAQRWVCGEVDIAALRDKVAGAGGSLCAFQRHASDVPRFHPLAAAMLRLQRNIKSSFDPAGIFNPGKLYPGL